MSIATTITMICINLFVMGGFLFFLRIAIRKEKRKKDL